MNVAQPRYDVQTKRRRTALRMARAVAVTWVLSACHRGGVTSGPPSLQRLTPDRGDVTRGAVVDVLVQGVGFDSLNTVLFGDLTLTQVRRVTPTTLRFSVPMDDAQRTPRSEAPPIALASGAYPVRVVTRRGTSNALPFTVQRAGGAR